MVNSSAIFLLNVVLGLSSGVERRWKSKNLPIAKVIGMQEYGWLG